MLNNVAVIQADACIGCNKCVPVCPVDCIVGAPQYLHMVIEHECIGCNKCLPVCPVDCIDIVKKDFVLDKQQAKYRVSAKKQRLEQQKKQQRNQDLNTINNIENKLKKLLDEKKADNRNI